MDALTTVLDSQLTGVLVGTLLTGVGALWVSWRASRTAKAAATATRQRESREAEAALSARHRGEARALLSSLVDLARVIRHATEEDVRLNEGGGVAPRQGVRQAMREVEARCWDLMLDCPPDLAEVTATTMTRTRRVVHAAIQGHGLVSPPPGVESMGEEPENAADDLSREYGDACRAYFRGDATGPRLSVGPPPMGPVHVVPPLPDDWKKGDPVPGGETARTDGPAPV